jgi:hypothetical protein
VGAPRGKHDQRGERSTELHAASSPICRVLWNLLPAVTLDQFRSRVAAASSISRSRRAVPRANEHWTAPR